MKILVIGTSPDKSKGGMATVLGEIRDDCELNQKFDIEIFDSFIDGSKMKRAFYSIYAYLKFILTKRGYDVYHIHAASSRSTFRKGYYIRAAKRWGKKVILHIHGGRYMEFYNELSPGNKQKVIKILKTADMVIALSDDWKEKFDHTFHLTNCVVLENGININSLLPAVTDTEMYQKAFLVLGRLGKKKGTYDLIDAVERVIQQVPDIKVYLAGDGDVEKIKNIVKEKHLKNNIEVVGWADFSKKLDLLKHVSTVVLPSYNEGLPMSVLEGMACGKAVISTTVGAIPEVVKKENGILIAPGDIDRLADALVKCCTDIDMLRCMSTKNMEKMNAEYSMKTMHEKLACYYEKVMNL